MSAAKSQPHLSDEETVGLIELIETALTASDIEELAERILTVIAGMMHSNSVLLYITDPWLPEPYFLNTGFKPEAVSGIEVLCAEKSKLISNQADFKPITVSSSPDLNIDDNLILYPLRAGEICPGLLGLTPVPYRGSADFTDRLLRFLAYSIRRYTEFAKTSVQLSYLNNYLTVSSMLAQSLDLHELIDIALHCCMETVSAEAASVLLLDDDKKNFYFYHAEGPAKPVLMTATFPIDKGIAGSVLEARQAEIINDVRKDPRFFGRIDSDSGFQTRNMIAVPLIAGEEKIGVLEVLNKAHGASFTVEEHLLMVMIAEEIAFAIRNARVFEYVVNSYCKQRQGQSSCKGCKRPLGSWTPCVKYRETEI